MAGGGGTQTTSSNSEPWDAAQPTMRTSLAGANNLYNAGVGGQVYTGSTVVPWAQQTMQGASGIQRNATANSGSRGLSGQYQGIINNGGFNSAQQGAMRNTQQLANSQYSISPELQKVIGAQSAQAADQVNASVAGAGRYGSAVHQGNLASTIGDLTNKTVYGDMQNWQGRRDAANSNLFNMGQTGIGNLGTAYTGMNAPNQDLMNVGGLYEDLATRQMNDRLRVFNESQDRPWELLGRLNSVASGAGQQGGTQTQTQPGQNPFLTAIGYGASGLGALGSFL
jgi:hypothetical protein